MSDFPPPLPHDPIRELFPDVYVVRSRFRVGPMAWIPRNMIIVREGDALTLVNAVRLSKEGEAELEKLGKVKHLVKLGHFHTLDDPYTRDRFAPTFWAPAPPDAKTEKLVDGGPSPLSKATPFVFRAGQLGEAALVLEQAAGPLLITCDSVQNWANTDGCSLMGALACRVMGFLEPAKIGPIWIKRATDGEPSRMWPDFERLLARDFRHLIAGHGDLLRDDAKAALTRSCDKTLGRRPTAAP
jgi:hypothetical protein